MSEKDRITQTIQHLDKITEIIKRKGLSERILDEPLRNEFKMLMNAALGFNPQLFLEFDLHLTRIVQHIEINDKLNQQRTVSEFLARGLRKRLDECMTRAREFLIDPKKYEI